MAMDLSRIRQLRDQTRLSGKQRGKRNFASPSRFNGRPATMSISKLAMKCNSIALPGRSIHPLSRELPRGDRELCTWFQAARLKLALCRDYALQNGCDMPTERNFRRRIRFELRCRD